MTTLTLLKVDYRTGELTVRRGREAWPPPAGAWVAGLHEFEHGYVVANARGTVLDRRNMVAMASHPVRPRPPGGWYAPRFERTGPNNALSIGLSSLAVPGAHVVFEAVGAYNLRAVVALFEASLDHLDTPAGVAGFVHPVVRLRADCRARQHLIWFVRFDVVDWLHADGERRWSKHRELELA